MAYKDGEKVLRAKIDMASPNINMRDPVIYRVAHMTHHNTGDKWCIYPMYDFAHPIEDRLSTSHTLSVPLSSRITDRSTTGQQESASSRTRRARSEFAKMYLTNVVTGKRYIKKLVEDGIVDGWDDPRLVTIAAPQKKRDTHRKL